MSLEQHLSLYKEDLRRAYRIYSETVAFHTVGDFGVIPLDEEELYRVVGIARATKSQAFGVATKRLKAAILVEHLDTLAGAFDLTFTLAQKIARSLIGRAISKPQLLEHCATAGRTAKSKSPDLSSQRFKILCESPAYIECQQMLGIALDQLETLKAEVSEEAAIIALSERAQKQLSQSAKAGGC